MRRRNNIKKWSCTCTRNRLDWAYYKHRPYKTKVNYNHGRKSKPIIKIICKNCGRVTYG